MNQQPRLLLMGLKRSGKSSIQQVVFQRLAPTETVYLESTTRPVKQNYMSFVQLSVWDIPAGHSAEEENMFKDANALVFVVDAQDDYIEALSKLFQTLARAYRVHPSLPCHVFIHKVDGLSDEHCIGTFEKLTSRATYHLETHRDMHQRLTDELADHDMQDLQLHFHLTSIYDHSIYEAFSKVVQQLIPCLPTLEHLLNLLCTHSGVEKAYLFDVTTKIFIATDSSPVDTSYELCSDMLDVLSDLSLVYSAQEQSTQEIAPTSSLMHLTHDMTLYAREVYHCLALVCLVRQDVIQFQGLLEHNVKMLSEALVQVFAK